MRSYSTSMANWSEVLAKATTSFDIYAPVRKKHLDYELISEKNLEQIVYNEARPSTPLKAFFFPIKENVVLDQQRNRKRVILGAPACDLHALNLLDKIFLDPEFLDTYYRKNREDSILIGTDCYTALESCHCTSYGLHPYPEKNFDIRFSLTDGKVILQPATQKGSDFIQQIRNTGFFEGEVRHDMSRVEARLGEVEKQLNTHNRDVPDTEASARGILASADEVWKKHAKKCVSCGACAAICPTCHCFLLIDRKNFEKVKNWDTCQYPAFGRVAAGEDPLHKLFKRLRNRYLCKFVHKPAMFGELACTGCGRCIDACIAGINKNEVLIDVCS